MKESPRMVLIDTRGIQILILCHEACKLVLFVVMVLSHVQKNCKELTPCKTLNKIH